MARANQHRDAVAAADGLQAELDRILGPSVPVLASVGERQLTVKKLATMRALSRAQASAVLRELVAAGRARFVGRCGAARVYELA